jgi:hypothetical protein
MLILLTSKRNRRQAKNFALAKKRRCAGAKLAREDDQNVKPA